MSGVDLWRELVTACGAFRMSRHWPYLQSQGVTRETFAELGRHHPGIGIVHASAGDDGLYFPDDSGAAHLLLPVYEDGELADLVAFQSAAPSKWMLRVGAGWALGVRDGFGPHCWEGTVRLADDPLDWLRGGAAGLAVVDWASPEVSALADLTSVQCSDVVVRALKGALTKPPRIPNIIRQEQRYAA